MLRGSPASQARWLGPAVSSKAVLAFAVGWALAFFAGTSVFWWVYSSGQEIANSRAPELGVFGLVGGAATLVGLRLAAPGSRTLPGLWVVLIAVVVSILGRWVSPTLQESGIDVHTSLAMERTLLGSLGGALMATALAYRGLTTRDGALRGASDVLNAYARQIQEAIARDGFFVRVPAGKQFYLYVTETIDQARATRANRAVADLWRKTHEN